LEYGFEVFENQENSLLDTLNPKGIKGINNFNVKLDVMNINTLLMKAILIYFSIKTIKFQTTLE